MFEVGDNVVVDGDGVRGVIVDFYYDEGNVWVVEVDGHPGVELECADDELTPANSIQPYNGNERHIYS
jgi:hypothetical protein